MKKSIKNNKLKDISQNNYGFNISVSGQESL